MESPELYIPPCCIHKQLPALLQKGGAFSVFYSQGDWGLPKLTFAVARLVPNNQVTTILVMPDATLTTARYIQKELDMFWSQAIILITATDQTQLLRDNISTDHLSRLTYCPGRKEAESNNLWIRHSPASHLLIAGPIWPDDSGPRRVCAYTATYAAASAGSSAAGSSSASASGSSVSGSSSPSVSGSSSASSTAGGVHITRGVAEAPAAPIAPRLQQAFAPWRSMVRLHATLRGTDPLFDRWLK